MSSAIAAVDRKKYIAKREKAEARRNPADVAAALAAVVGKFNHDHTYFIYYKCVDIIKTFVMLILYNVTYLF